MRIILLVLMFLIWEESATPVTGHWQRVTPPLGICLFFCGYLVIILAMRLWGTRLARGVVRGDPGRAISRFNRGMSAARLFIPAWFAVGVFVLGWKPLVDRMLGPIANWPIVTPGTVLALLPGFTGWMGLWWSQYPVDRALREQNILYQLESDLPVFSPPAFRGYFLNKLRVQVLFTSVPLVVILGLRDLGVVGIAALSHTHIGRQWGVKLPITDSLEQSLSFASVLLVLLFSPELLRRVLHTQRLPESDLRQSLCDLCSNAGIRCREILLWQTQNNMGNAAVMGLVPRVRYVMLSDLLLESMTDLQIQAVFAHELGHVKHRHLAWFILFFITVGSCLFALAAVLEDHLSLSDNWREAFDIGSMLTCGAVLMVGYGFLSRWFERQADVYAARTLEITTEAPARGFGALVFASALERVAVVNNIPMTAPNWTHGSIQSRVRYIHHLGRDPRVAERFDRTGKWVFFGLIFLIAICGTVAIYLSR